MSNGVRPLDPDFLCFALPFAIFVDAIDIFLELTSFIVIPKILGIAIDLFVFAILGGWMYLRTGQAAERKGRRGGRLAKKPLRRAFRRGGLALIGEVIPFLGLMPFWTITVFLTLKGEK